MTTSRKPLPAGGLLACYEALESASRDRLAAARDGRWDRVEQIEQVAARLVEQLRRRLRDGTLDAHETRAKLRIMRRIVENDAEVRYLAQPRLRALDALLTGQRLH